LQAFNPFNLNQITHKPSDDQLHQKSTSSSTLFGACCLISCTGCYFCEKIQTTKTKKLPCTCPEVGDSLVQILLMLLGSALSQAGGPYMITTNQRVTVHLSLEKNTDIVL